MEKPHKAQYGGGIVLNPELDDGLEGWSAFGEAKIEERVSGGNNFIVAHSRNQPYDSSSQKLHLQKDKLYTFSGIYLSLPQGFLCAYIVINHTSTNFFSNFLQ